MKLACLSPLPGDAFAALPPDLGIEVHVLEDRTAAGAAAIVPGADLVLGDFAGEVAVTAAVADAMDRARIYHQPSTGYDWVDVDALTARRIPMTTAGRATSVAMGEYSVMAALALLRSLVWLDGQVRAGAWPQHDVVSRSLVDLQGKTVGLVGMGGAGEEAAKRFAVFGCRVLYTSRHRRPPEFEQRLQIEWAELDTLLTESDLVCLLTELNASTRGLIGAQELGRMKPSAFLINPARGGLVDEVALVHALRSGRIKGAALDVFDTEPLPASSPLRTLDNVVLTPHVAGASLEARLRILDRAFSVLTLAARGELPDGVINGIATLRL